MFYGYKYRLEAPLGNAGREHDDFLSVGEADFVVVHPELGYAVFEVKQGNIIYADGQWHEFKPVLGGAHRTRPMAKDPVEQAQRAMWAILERYKDKSGEGRFPLHIRYAVCFPETKKLAGELPDHIDPKSIFVYDDLQKLDARIRSLFPKDTIPQPFGDGFSYSQSA